MNKIGIKLQLLQTNLNIIVKKCINFLSINLRENQGRFGEVL